MIICHAYKLIFLKTTKTAGTSIEFALSRFCGDDDVITPNAPADERIRKQLGYRGFQNCIAPPWEYRPSDLVRLFRERYIKLRFSDHMPARAVRPLVGDAVWNGYFKFCFERNPWDRVLSHYHWYYRKGPKAPFSEFFDSGEWLRLRRSGFELYTIDGEIAVDRVCRYEDLTEELEAVRVRVGIPESLTLPRVHASSRTDTRHYREVFDAAQAERVGKAFEREIALFGYEF